MQHIKIVTVSIAVLLFLSACGDKRLHKEAQESFEKGDYSKAKVSATALVNKYPKSKYASLAQDILQKLDAIEAEEQRKRLEERLKELIEALNNRETRRGAIKELGEIGDKRAVEPLIEALKYEKTREDVIEALGKIKDERAVEPLIAIIKNKDEYIQYKYIRHIQLREAAVVALAQIDINYIPPLIESFARPLDDIWVPPLIVQDKVRDVIEKIGEPAVEALIDVLKKTQKGKWAPRVRKEVTEILERFGDKRAVEPLIAVLRRGNEDHLWWERQHIAKTLGSIGDDRAVEPLIEALTSVNKISRGEDENTAMDEIVKALEKITNQDFGRDPKKWKEWWKENKVKTKG